MQSHTQGSKNNKITVPFYSPPTRFHGPTPAEIIKEARAAVMATPAIGIKPVFTSRPFTPKEKERTLFGNLKKKSKRPPSSFSLKSLQGQEQVTQVSHVKLPSIDVVTKRKSHSIFHYSNNLSLDNLSEDYDAETLEAVGEKSNEKLPPWKKSHSCPKEGRMVKAASIDELNPRIFSDKNSDWSIGVSDKIKKFCEKQKNDSENQSKTQCDSKKQGSISTIFGDTVKEEPLVNSINIYRYTEMTRGSGDYDKTNTYTENFLQKDTFKEPFLNSIKAEKDDEAASLVSHKTLPNTDVKEAENEKQTQLVESNEKISMASKVAEEKSKDKDLEEEKEPGKVNILSDKIENLVKVNRITSSEKSMTTIPKSDYLLTLTVGHKPVAHEKRDPVPLEIMELYQTAKYYGVDLMDNGQQTKSKTTLKETPTTAMKELEDKAKETTAENSVKVDSNKEVLKAQTNKDLPTENQMKEKKEAEKKSTNNINSSGKIEYEMNNKTKYHAAPDKKEEKKEKAYEKWKKQQASTPEPEKTSTNQGWNVFWESSYYKMNKDSETKDDDCKTIKKEVDLESLERLVKRMHGLSKIGMNGSYVYEANCQLYHLLKNSEIVLEKKTKNNILKALALYIDNEEPKVLISLARLLLHLRVDCSLSAACKIIFKVARSDTNDHLFLNEDDILELFMEGIGRASPLECAESCVYGYGALKFLTMNYNILSRTLHMGALDLITLHLKLINSAFEEKGNVEEQTQHALFQLTGALRHIAAGEGALPLFITTNCISIICKSLELFQKDEDIVTNISRTLSLISTDSSVANVLTSVENVLSVMINLMDKYKENDKILIRLSFCLGNIVEHSDLARVQLSRNENGLTILLDLLKFYIDKDLQLSIEENKTGDLNSDIVDDIIVKVIRIIANMSMNPIVGSNLSPVTKEKKSLQLSHLLSILLMRKDPGIVLLATLGCLNNISYYSNNHSVLIDITQGVERVLGLPSTECQTEAARVLGNLTRHKEIRDLIYSTEGVNKLANLLSSEDPEVVKCACGALVNMMLDPETRKLFIEDKGVDKLVTVFERFSGNWSLASLAGRAIWNSCVDDVSSAMVHNNMEHLSNILANSLEEENWNDGDTDWEEFAAIATDLLEKINYHLDST